ncbi:MAG: hypothetical protein ACO2O2_13685 [Acidilobaceae archaeon]|nr:hypothetical protein [Desulfurococcaceae archaeon]MCC6060648.1 hypothetical protein [Desulfurococcaceae archaeon]MDT7866087.1 hypothetical protein [Desulfurococcales archaeon]
MPASSLDLIGLDSRSTSMASTTLLLGPPLVASLSLRLSRSSSNLSASPEPLRSVGFERVLRVIAR